MTILYLSYDGLTDALGQSQILPYLCGLSQFGYRIVIISAEKKEVYTRRKQVIESIIKQYKLIWEPIFYTKKPPVASTLWDVYQIQKKAFELHEQYNFKIVHCRSYIAALVGLTLKKKKSVKFIFDMRGFWADERVEGSLWNLNNILYRKIYSYFKSKEKQFLKEADYTISLTYKAKEEIHSWQGLHSIPVQIIPCCVDTKVFSPVKGVKDRYLNKQNPDVHDQIVPFTISYLGSLGTWYMLDEMLQFYKRLLLQRPDARFLFITPDNPEIIVQKAHQLGVPAKSIIIKKAERNEVPTLLATSHLSIFFIKPTYSKIASSPTKMGEILSMGIPVICNAGVGDTEYLFNQFEPGILVKGLDDQSYDKAISQIEATLQIPPGSLRQIALDYFALKKGVDLYHQVYQKVL